MYIFHVVADDGAVSKRMAGSLDALLERAARLVILKRAGVRYSKDRNLEWDEGAGVVDAAHVQRSPECENLKGRAG